MLEINLYEVTIKSYTTEYPKKATYILIHYALVMPYGAIPLG